VAPIAQRVFAKKVATGFDEEILADAVLAGPSDEKLTSRCGVVAIRPASRDWRHSTAHPSEWLLIEWPEGEKDPAKYRLSRLPRHICRSAKLCWRIERDYKELKSEFGLSRISKAGMARLSSSATLCIAAFGFLICERAAIANVHQHQTSRLRPKWPSASNNQRPIPPNRGTPGFGKRAV
jgi:SRSO17 transposase